jgi:hypothetical protein
VLEVPRPQVLLGSIEMGVVSPGKLGYMSLTVRLATCPQLLLHVR